MKQLNVVPSVDESGRELINDDFGSTRLGVGRVAPREKNYSHVSAEALMFVLLSKRRWYWKFASSGQVLNAFLSGAEAKWNEFECAANGITYWSNRGMFTRRPCDGYFLN